MTQEIKHHGLKFIITLSFFLLLATGAFAQADTIFLHNGEVVTGKVTRIAEKTVQFSYENEDAQQSYGKYAVDRIAFGKSGRVQYISDKIRVYNRGDWERVIVIDNTDEVAGLTRKGEVKGKTAFINYRTGEGSDKTALKKLKMDAAEIGCAFVYITTDKDVDRKGVDGGGFGQLQSIKKGFGYSY